VQHHHLRNIRISEPEQPRVTASGDDCVVCHDGDAGWLRRCRLGQNVPRRRH
jgi:hypothetical protein